MLSNNTFLAKKGGGGVQRPPTPLHDQIETRGFLRLIKEVSGYPGQVTTKWRVQGPGRGGGAKSKKGNQPWLPVLHANLSAVTHVSSGLPRAPAPEVARP